MVKTDIFTLGAEQNKFKTKALHNLKIADASTVFIIPPKVSCN